jgi:hypothetical protein
MAVCLVTGTACAREAVPTRPQETAALAMPPATLVPVAAEQASAARDAGNAAPPAAPTPAAHAFTTALKLIRTGQVSLEVESYDKAAEAIARLAETHGGYVADSQAGRAENDRRLGTLTLKVPSPRFAAALAELKALGRVEAEQVATQDVTKAYSDLETRLVVKRETAGRLREILKERTAKLSEILEAERELARVTEEIEQMEGERRFYDHQVALSTITAQVHEPRAVVRPGVFTPVTDALRESLGVLATSVAGLVYAAVFLAPWVLLALLAWRLGRAVRARRRAPAAIAG